MKKWIFVFVLLSSVANAAPPPGTDLNSEKHHWFEQQYNLNGGNCCGLGDGHVLQDNEWKNLGDHYEVLINGKWFSITPYKMRDVKPDTTGNEPLRGTPSPFGKAVVWYKYYNQDQIDNNKPSIYCFSPFEFME